MFPRQVKNIRMQDLKATNNLLTKNLCIVNRGVENHGVEATVEKSILEKLSLALNPLHLEVINESYMHNVPPGSETHFKVVIVSQQFENVPLISRHRLVNTLLQSELKNGVHALSIVAKTPGQWDITEKVQPSPRCQGGFGK